MSVEMVIRHCAPTLAGIKTGNLFSCDYSSRQELLEDMGFMDGVGSGKICKTVNECSAATETCLALCELVKSTLHLCPVLRVRES